MYNRIAIIDCDIVLWKVLPDKVGVEVERTFEEICQQFDEYIASILSNTECESYFLFFTGRNNFRKVVDENYKANRKGRELPKFFNELIDYAINKWKALKVDNIEADDAISIVSNNNDNEKNEVVICSIDKDLFQISGTHYNFVKSEWKFVSPEDAKYNLWSQVLSGDSTDCIKGIPKCGKKTADEYLKEIAPEDYPMQVLNKYIQYFGEEIGIEEFYKNYKLVKILTKPAYDFNVSEPISL